MDGSRKLRAAAKEAYSVCREIEKLGMSAAYRASHDCSNMKATAVNSNAKKLEKTPQVRLRMAWLRAHGLPGPGRPSDFEKAFCEQAEQLAKLGATDKEMAEFFGCSESTFNLWKKEHSEFSESIKAGKMVADMGVASKLHTRAMGFEYDEAHPIKLKKTTYENGKKIAEEEYVEVVPVKRVVPPDTPAGKFWLTNRRKNWKERVSNEHTGDGGKPIEVAVRNDIEQARRVAFALGRALERQRGNAA